MVLVCTRCGIIGANARPNWQEQPQRESLTGMQWGWAHDDAVCRNGISSQVRSAKSLI
jgi:hypothetical protein